MDTILQFGPLLLKIKWIIGFVAILCGYFALFYRLKNIPDEKDKIVDALRNSFIAALLIWKCSYAILSMQKESFASE